MPTSKANSSRSMPPSVKSHLTLTYNKLGITNRAALAAAHRAAEG
jgi:DNA-binding CsgD family transcriptional regulator